MATAMAVYVGAEGSELVVGLVVAVYYVGIMVFSPVWGAVADLTGRRRSLLVVTTVLASLAVIPLVFVDGLRYSIGGRLLYACFVAGFTPIMLGIVSDQGGSDRRGRAMGFYNSTRSSGFIGGQLLVGALLPFVVPSQMYFLVALIFGVAVAAAILVDDRSADAAEHLSTENLVGETKQRLFPKVENRAHFHTNGLDKLYVALGLRYTTVLGIGSLLPIFLIREVGVSSFVMGVLLAVNPTLQTVSMYFFGHYADDVGRKPLIVGGMVGSSLYALCIPLAPLPTESRLGVALVVVSFLLLGVSFAAMSTGVIAFIGDVAPSGYESELMGIRSTARGLGGVLGPVIIGGVATLTGMQVAFLGGSLLAIVATALTAVKLVESYPVRDATKRTTET